LAVAVGLVEERFYFTDQRSSEVKVCWEKHERPVSEAAVFSLEQYVCEMALETPNCETNASHNVSKRPGFLYAIVNVGEKEVGSKKLRPSVFGAVAPRAIGDDQAAGNLFSRIRSQFHKAERV